MSLFTGFPLACLRIRISGLFLILSLAANSQMKGPENPLNATSSQRNRSKSGFLGIYQNYISPISGKKCPMEPSCSRYSAQASRRFGPFAGLVLSLDRLTRCGNDLRRYPTRGTRERDFHLDPVPVHWPFHHTHE